MKKILLFSALVLSVLTANAWARSAEEAAVIVATQNISPKGQKLVKKYLGKTFEDDIRYLYTKEGKQAIPHTKEIHYLHLDKDFRPKNVGENDAYAAIEKAMEVLRTYKSHSKIEVTRALRTVICLMVDIHHMANIRIDNIPHSQRDFSYKYHSTEVGKKKDRLETAKWSSLGRNCGGYPRGFSGEWRAYDMTLYLGDRFAEYSKGTLKDWVADNGAVATRYLAIYKPDAVVSCLDHKYTDPVNYDLMVKAGCRLATLLNDVFK